MRALLKSVQEIVVVLITQSLEIIFCRALPGQPFAVAHLLNVSKAAGDAEIAPCVESVKVDADIGVAAGVHFRAVKDWLDGAVDDLRRMVGGGISVDKIAALVRLIIGAILIAVTQRQLDVLRDW